MPIWTLPSHLLFPKWFYSTANSKQLTVASSTCNITYLLSLMRGNNHNRRKSTNRFNPNSKFKFRLPGTASPNALCVQKRSAFQTRLTSDEASNATSAIWMLNLCSFFSNIESSSFLSILYNARKFFKARLPPIKYYAFEIILVFMFPSKNHSFCIISN